MTPMKKLTLSFGHSQTHDLVMAMVMGAGCPIDLIAYGHVPGHIVMLSLNHSTTPDGYAQVPPIIQQLLGASSLAGTHPDSRS